MLFFSATTNIDASPDTIWKILTDAAKYAEWDPSMIRLEGSIAPGHQLTIYSKLAPNRAFKPKVSVFEPNRKMVWHSGMPFGLFTGSRTFLLEGTAPVKFTLTEKFSGLMLPLIGKSIPDMNPVFEEFNAALKARAESA